MSAEFHCDQLEETLLDPARFVMWSRGGGQPMGVEVGSLTNLERLFNMCDMGMTFSSIERVMAPIGREWLEQASANGQITVGEFPVTVAADDPGHWVWDHQEGNV